MLKSWRVSALVLVPVSIVLAALNSTPIAVFCTSALALVPLAALLGFATEEIAGHVGPSLGGLLNATLGNATEMILGLILLWSGHIEVVKASLTGSIISNLLLVFGLATFVGGFRREKQIFNRLTVGASTAMLFLAIVAMVMPALFDITAYGSFQENRTIVFLSFWTAIVLLISYSASLVFMFRTHRSLFGQQHVELPKLSARAATLILVITTVLIAFESEILAGRIEAATHALGWTDRFVGLVILAIVGNAAEHSAAVMMARKDKMDLALSIAMGSSTQIALFVAPVLVVVSELRAQPMSLVFPPLEIVAVILSVGVVTLVSFDGETNWFEGLQLLSVYAILVIVFFFMPA